MRAVLLVWIAGCGGGLAGDDEGPDASTDLDGGEADAGPILPSPPEAPTLTPCPTGWREIADPDRPEITICDPWPETGPEDCAVDEAHFPGGAGCERIGTACPPGNFAEDIPGDLTVLYVEDGAAPGGDGTLALPFDTIAHALAAADPPTVVAISKGTFDEEVSVPADVTLWGACVAETVIASTTPSIAFATVSLRGAGATVRNLQISGARIGIKAEIRAATVRIESVVVSEATTLGLLAMDRSVVEADHVVIRDTLAVPADPTFGWGIDVHDASQVTVSHGVIERSVALGVGVDAVGGTFTATDLSVRDTRERLSDGEAGIGIAVFAGGHADLTNVVASRNLFDGIRVNDAGSSLVATQLVVEDTAPGGGSGVGLNAYAGGVAEVSRATIRRNRVAAATARDPDSRIVLTDVVLEDTDEREEDGGGSGVVVYDGGRVEIVRAALLRNQTTAMQAYGAGATLSGTDVVASDTRIGVIDPIGAGLEVHGGAAVDLTRVLVERSAVAGVLVEEPGSSLRATDTTVRDTAPNPEGVAGIGIQGGEGTTLELERVLVERCTQLGIGTHGAGAVLLATDVSILDTASRASAHDVGYGLDVFGGVRVEAHRMRIRGSHNAGLLVAYAGTTFDGTDIEILDTQSEEGSGDFGEGLEAIGQAVVHIDGGLFSGNHRGGVEAFDVGTVVALSDVVIERTQPKDAGGGGTGIVAVDGALVTATGFRIADNALCGVQLALGGEIDLSDGEVSGSPIGANIQTPDFDLGRLQSGVAFRDNDTNLDSSAVPVPEAATSIDP